MTDPVSVNQDSDPTLTPPEFDPELMAALAAAGVSSLAVGLTADGIPDQRALARQREPSREEVERDDRFAFRDAQVTSADGFAVPLLIARPRAVGAAAPILYVTHGGGLISGTYLYSLPRTLQMAAQLGCIVVTVDYRLAPEHPYPAAHDDAWAGLVWTAEQARELGGEADRIVLFGGSAGANLAASLALRARDSRRLTPCAQVLVYPMLDERSDSLSARQMEGRGVWDRVTNRTAWEAVLPGLNGPAPADAAPARATDLSGLPPTYLEVGSAETFRDETIVYAQRIWQAGGEAELHVWPGAFHGFDVFAPDARVSAAARRARVDWLQRTLAPAAG